MHYGLQNNNIILLKLLFNKYIFLNYILYKIQNYINTNIILYT